MQQQSRSKIHLESQQNEQEKIVQHPLLNTNLLKTATFFDPLGQVISSQHNNQDKLNLKVNDQQSENQQQQQHPRQLLGLRSQKQSTETRDNSPSIQLSFRTRYKSLQILKTEGASSYGNHESPIINRQASFALGLLSSPQSQNLKFMNRKSSFLGSKMNLTSEKNEEFSGTDMPNAVDIEFWKKVKTIITASEGQTSQTDKTNQEQSILNSNKKQQQLLPAIPQRTKKHYRTDIIPFKKNILMSSNACLDVSSCSTNESFRHNNQPEIICKKNYFQKPFSQGSCLGVMSPTSDSRIFYHSLKLQPSQQQSDGELNRTPQTLNSLKSSQNKCMENSFQACCSRISAQNKLDKQQIVETQLTYSTQSPSNTLSYYPQISNQFQQNQIKPKRRGSFLETMNQPLKQCQTATNNQCNEKISEEIDSKVQINEYEVFELDRNRLTRFGEGKQNEEFSFSVEQQAISKDCEINARNLKNQYAKKTNYLSKQQDSVVKKLFKIEERHIHNVLSNSSIIDSQQQQRFSFLKQGPHAQSLKQLFQQNLIIKSDGIL